MNIRLYCQGRMLVYVVLGACLGLSVNALEETNSSIISDDDVYYPSLNWSDTFDWKLFKALAPKYHNIVVSPISLKLVLALLYQGSSGSTKREFESVLQFLDKGIVRNEFRQMLESLQIAERKEYTLNLGTRIFLDSHIQPQQQFASIAQKSFRTEIELTDFKDQINASQAVNSWTEKLTNGRITQMVKPDDLQDTIMIIANAIYFKATWKHQFPKNQTQPGKFFVTEEEELYSISAQFMSIKEKFYYLESTSYDAKILRLPYRDSRYSMFIILPNSKGGLPSLIRKINLHSLKTLVFLLDKRVVDVKIPKFSFKFESKLKKTLENFGLYQMFQNTASFGAIARGNNSLLRMLVVSDVIQKSGIEVDEVGSVAFASTVINIGNKFGESETVFEATHPFLFYIEEESSGTILFVGKVDNPLDEVAVPVQVD